MSFCEELGRMPLRHFVQFVVIWKAEINPEGDVPFLSFFLFFSCIHFIGGRKSNADEVPRFSCAWVMINRNIGKTEKVLRDLVCATFPKLSQLYLFWRKLASTFFKILLMEHLHLCSPVLSNPNTRKILALEYGFPLAYIIMCTWRPADTFLWMKWLQLFHPLTVDHVIHTLDLDLCQKLDRKAWSGKAGELFCVRQCVCWSVPAWRLPFAVALHCPIQVGPPNSPSNPFLEVVKAVILPPVLVSWLFQLVWHFTFVLNDRHLFHTVSPAFWPCRLPNFLSHISLLETPCMTALLWDAI